MTETVSQAVAALPKGVDIARRNSTRFEAVLPRHIEARPFVGMAEAALYRDEKLMEAAGTNPQAFFSALMKCAALGHRPGSEEFYLIPRKVKGRLEVQGIEGYRGIVERMYRSGAVASVIVREVCEKDDFRYVEGEMTKPVHRIDWFGGDRGKMIGVYAYAIMTTGAVSRVVILNADDITKIRARSDGSTSEFSPWNRDERAMWWKSAARRLEPWVPTSVEFFKERVRASAEVNHTTVERPASGQVDLDTGEIDDVVDGELVDDYRPGGSPASKQAEEQIVDVELPDPTADPEWGQS